MCPPNVLIEGQPPPLADFGRPLPRRTRSNLPGALATLASVHRGNTCIVRSVLNGAGESAALLRPGDVLICRSRTTDWIIAELAGRGELAIHRADARHVRIERSAAVRNAHGPGDPCASGPQSQR